MALDINGRINYINQAVERQNFIVATREMYELLRLAGAQKQEVVQQVSIATKKKLDGNPLADVVMHNIFSLEAMCKELLAQDPASFMLYRKIRKLEEAIDNKMGWLNLNYGSSPNTMAACTAIRQAIRNDLNNYNKAKEAAHKVWVEHRRRTDGHTLFIFAVALGVSILCGDILANGHPDPGAIIILAAVMGCALAIGARTFIRITDAVGDRLGGPAHVEFDLKETKQVMLTFSETNAGVPEQVQRHTSSLLVNTNIIGNKTPEVLTRTASIGNFAFTS